MFGMSGMSGRGCSSGKGGRVRSDAPRKELFISDSWSCSALKRFDVVPIGVENAVISLSVLEEEAASDMLLSFLLLLILFLLFLFFRFLLFGICYRKLQGLFRVAPLAQNAFRRPQRLQRQSQIYDVANLFDDRISVSPSPV